MEVEWGLRHRAVGLHHHGARTERADVQPEGSRSRSAVIRKRQGPLRRLAPVDRIGDVEHERFRLAFAVLDRHAAGRGGVPKGMAVHGDLVVGHVRRALVHVEVERRICRPALAALL